MRKLKTLLVLLLTLALITAGANLPKIVSAVRDRTAGNEVQYGTMQSVELVLSEEPETLPAIAKLALMRGTFYRISESEAEMTHGEVVTAVEKALAPYYEWEMISCSWDDAQITLTPYFVNNPNDEDHYSIFWEVAAVWELQENYYLNLYLDDETGKILFLDYKSGTALEVYDLQSYLNLFRDIFLASLGVDGDASTWNDMGMEEDISASGTAAARYVFSNGEYSEVVIGFYVYSHGFYSYVAK